MILSCACAHVQFVKFRSLLKRQRNTTPGIALSVVCGITEGNKTPRFFRLSWPLARRPRLNLCARPRMAPKRRFKATCAIWVLTFAGRTDLGTEEEVSEEVQDLDEASKKVKEEEDGEEASDDDGEESLLSSNVVCCFFTRPTTNALRCNLYIIITCNHLQVFCTKNHSVVCSRLRTNINIKCV